MPISLEKRLVVLLLATWIGVLPAWAAEEEPANVQCEEMFRRTIREELGKGDEVWIIYGDGHVVRGRFMGFVHDRPEFLVAPGEGGLEVSEPYELAGMQTLSYRRLASDGNKILIGGALVGFVVGVFTISMAPALNNGTVGTSPRVAAYFGFLGALAGFGVGMFLPRLLIHAKTVECGPSPVYDGGADRE